MSVCNWYKTSFDEIRYCLIIEFEELLYLMWHVTVFTMYKTSDRKERLILFLLSSKADSFSTSILPFLYFFIIAKFKLKYLT
jgi:hypothetical protein